jgi:hypothetical protein
VFRQVAARDLPDISLERGISLEFFERSSLTHDVESGRLPRQAKLALAAQVGAHLAFMSEVGPRHIEQVANALPAQFGLAERLHLAEMLGIAADEVEGEKGIANKVVGEIDGLGVEPVGGTRQ